MPSTNQDVTVWQGNSLGILVPVKNKDGTLPDLTLATIRWWMGLSAFAQGGEILIEKSYDAGVNNGIQLTVGLPNQFEVILQPADTLNIPPGGYYHEASVLLADGTTLATVTTGAFILDQTMIRA